MPRVFISYRRDDTLSEAGRLADYLCQNLGPNNVFFDIDTIRAGEDFADKIDHAVSSYDVLIAIIGAKWLGSASKLRLNSPNDFVKLEIAAALKRNIRVIPVLINGAPLPQEQDLPAELASLTRRNYFEIQDKYFKRDAKELLRELYGQHALWHSFMRRPAVWTGLFAAALAMALIILRVKTSAPSPALSTQLLQPPLEAKVHLKQQFGPVDSPPDMLLKHSLPILSGPTLVTGKTSPVGQYEYESSVLMRSDATKYLGYLSRYLPPDASHKAQPDGMTICFEPTKDRSTAAQPGVRVECEEGAPCNISSDDFGWAKACGSKQANKAKLFTPPVVYANTDQAVGPQVGWVVPSLDTLRKAGARVAFTEFSFRSGPSPLLKAANRINVVIHVNDTPLYIDGLPFEANNYKFDSAAGLHLQFGLENLDFSGADAGYENIKIAITFLKDEQPVRPTYSFVVKYVALRPVSEAPIDGAPDFHLSWHADYHTGKKDDVYQVFALSQRSLQSTQRVKKEFDAAHFQFASGPSVAVLRPPLPNNLSYGVALGYRTQTGQVKFSFDDATSKAVCREALKIAARSRLVNKGVFRRSIDNRSRSQQCSAF